LATSISDWPGEEPSRVPLQLIAVIVLILAAGSGFIVGALAFALDMGLPFPGWVRVILVAGAVLILILVGVAVLVLEVAKGLRLSRQESFGGCCAALRAVQKIYVSGQGNAAGASGPTRMSH
jgi:hypothetical protein